MVDREEQLIVPKELGLDPWTKLVEMRKLSDLLQLCLVACILLVSLVDHLRDVREDGGREACADHLRCD